MVSQERYNELFDDCMTAQAELKRAQKQVWTYQNDMLTQRKKRLTDTKAWATMNTLFESEQLILVNLALHAEKKDLDAEALARWSDIVKRIDLEARWAKMTLATNLTLGSCKSFDQWKVDKVILRDLVRKHWNVLDYITNEEAEVPSRLKKGVDDLEAALQKVGWLFVIFVCYGRQDAAHLNNLIRLSQRRLKKGHLVLWFGDKRSFLEQKQSNHRKQSEPWWEANVPLDNWYKDLLDHIDDVDLGVTLVSKRLFDEIDIEEFPKTLQHRQEQGMRILPLMLDNYKSKQHSWLNPTDPLPDGGKTVTRNYSHEKDLKRLYSEFVVRLDSMVTDLSNVENALLRGECEVR